MNKIYIKRLIRAIFILTLYVEGYYSAFMTGNHGTSGRVQGGMAGIIGITLIILIGLPIYEYRKSRSLHKAFAAFKALVLVILDADFGIKNKYKNFIYHLAATTLFFWAAYHLLFGAFPDLYNKTAILTLVAFGIFSGPQAMAMLVIDLQNYDEKQKLLRKQRRKQTKRKK